MKISGKWISLLIGVSLWAGGSQATVLYSQMTANTGIPGLGRPETVTNPNINGLANCTADTGCMGFGSSVPVQDFTLSFSITPSELAAIQSSTGSGQLTVTASRDIGVRNGDPTPGTEFLIVKEGGQILGNLYQNLMSTASMMQPGRCTNSIHNEDPPVALDCGPNFDNDITATESLPISQTDFQSFAADGTINFFVHPTMFNIDCSSSSTCGVGRLKLFSATLDFSVPEPGSMVLLASGLIALALAKRNRKTELSVETKAKMSRRKLGGGSA